MNEGPSWKGLPISWAHHHANNVLQSEGWTKNRVSRLFTDHGWEIYDAEPGHNKVTDGEITVVLRRGRQANRPVWFVETVLRFLTVEESRLAATGVRVYKRRPAAISHW